MSRVLRLSVLFWFLSLSVLFGQTDSLSVYIKAKLINIENEEAIAFANILLKAELLGVTSNIDGFFNIKSSPNDSLLITSIGYQSIHIAAKDLISDSSLNIIKLSPQIYMLDEIKITQYATYEEMVEAITNPVLTLDEKNIFRAYSNLAGAGLSFKERKNDGIVRGGIGGPITGIYNLFSRSVKNQKKFNKIKEDEKNIRKFKRIINDDLISQITGLSDSVTIVKFIKYCNFSESYLNNSTEYVLIKRIKQNFEAFKQSDQDH